MTPDKHNAEMIEAERVLQNLVARVFGAADPGDVDQFLRELAGFTMAFHREAVVDPSLRDIYQGRRQVFFWLADHLKLDLAVCWPRYLKSTGG